MNKEMNKQRGLAPIAIVIIALIILGGGYLLLSQKGPAVPVAPETNNPPVVTEPIAPPPPVATPILTIALKAQKKSGETGTTTISSLSDGTTLVSIALDGAPADAPQPAHIHLKACKDKGAVKYSLTDVVNGVSETILNMATADLLKDVPLSINAHQSAEKLDVSVTCGDISAADKKAGLDIIKLMTPEAAPVEETASTTTP